MARLRFASADASAYCVKGWGSGGGAKGSQAKQQTLLGAARTISSAVRQTSPHTGMPLTETKDSGRDVSLNGSRTTCCLQKVSMYRLLLRSSRVSSLPSLMCTAFTSLDTSDCCARSRFAGSALAASQKCSRSRLRAALVVAHVPGFHHEESWLSWLGVCARRAHSGSNDRARGKARQCCFVQVDTTGTKRGVRAWGGEPGAGVPGAHDVLGVGSACSAAHLGRLEVPEAIRRLVPCLGKGLPPCVQRSAKQGSASAASGCMCGRSHNTCTDNSGTRIWRASSSARPAYPASPIARPWWPALWSASCRNPLPRCGGGVYPRRSSWRLAKYQEGDVDGARGVQGLRRAVTNEFLCFAHEALVVLQSRRFGPGTTRGAGSASSAAASALVALKRSFF